jgi:tripartite-type tricarboxylate transporter receptor subunit TctC
MVHVPFKGSGHSVIGLVGGQVDMLVIAIPAALGQIQAGRARALAVLAPKRVASLPDVPTAKEAGVDNFEVLVWYGILAPAATPRDIITRINGELKRVVSSPDAKERFANAGVEPMYTTPEEFGKFIMSESARFGKVIKDAGIKGE